MALVDFACSWHCPLGAVLTGPETPGLQPIWRWSFSFCQKVERARDCQRGGRRGFQPRVRPGGEKVPGPLRGK